MTRKGILARGRYGITNHSGNIDIHNDCECYMPESSFMVVLIIRRADLLEILKKIPNEKAKITINHNYF